MPELPEVEVVKKSLENQICNLTIKDIKLNDINLRYKVKKSEINKIIGHEISRIERRSKYLLFFQNTILSHNHLVLVYLNRKMLMVFRIYKMLLTNLILM